MDNFVHFRCFYENYERFCTLFSFFKKVIHQAEGACIPSFFELWMSYPQKNGVFGRESCKNPLFSVLRFSRNGIFIHIFTFLWVDNPYLSTVIHILAPKTPFVYIQQKCITVFFELYRERSTSFDKIALWIKFSRKRAWKKLSTFPQRTFSNFTDTSACVFSKISVWWRRLPLWYLASISPTPKISHCRERVFSKVCLILAESFCCAALKTAGGTSPASC